MINPLKIALTRLWYWLQRRANKDRENLGLFVSGAVIFFLGGGMIYAANLRMEPSLLQELVALVGVVLCATGAIVAALGYIALSFLRLIRRDNHHDSKNRRS